MFGFASVHSCRKSAAWMTLTVEVSDAGRLGKVLEVVAALSGVRSARRKYVWTIRPALFNDLKVKIRAITNVVFAVYECVRNSGAFGKDSTCPCIMIQTEIPAWLAEEAT